MENTGEKRIDNPLFFENKDSFLDLANQGAKFIILVLDQGAGRDMPYTIPHLQAFYERAFMLLEDKEIGLLIKPKKLWVIEAGEIKFPKERVICDDNPRGRNASYWGFGCDFVVAMHSTAAIECSHIGMRVAMWYSGVTFSPGLPIDWKMGEDKFLFKDLDLMFSLVREYKKNPQAMSYLGDWYDFYNNCPTGNNNPFGEVNTVKAYEDWKNFYRKFISFDAMMYNERKKC